MSTALKVVLQGLVLTTLVCVGLGGHPQAFGAVPLEPTSIRSGLSPDSQCVVVRRTMSPDSGDPSTPRPSLVGQVPVTLVVAPASWHLVPAGASVDSTPSSRLVIHGPRARAPPSSTFA